jgi:hypothetical protein
MISKHSFMKLRGVVAVALLGFAALGTACTKPNPLSCSDGLCSDPAFPFCDVNGEVEGAAGTCIAVACTPADFAGCRGDFAITCNATGDNFDLVECARGCEEGTGCRLCDPNETACTNGTVATCDASGAVVSSQACPLGCFEDEPRCRDIDPSNNLSQFLDMVAAPPDLDLKGATIFTDTGLVMVGADPVDVPSFLLPAPAGGAAIRVFVVGALRLENVGVAGSSIGGSQGPALAFVANGDVVLEGRLTLDSNAGQVFFSECLPGAARETRNEASTKIFSAGGGGGGHATSGGTGGDVPTETGVLTGGRGGLVSGTAELVPLRGGCAGSGAIQISSRTQLTIAGVIDVRGGTGSLEQGTLNVDIGGGGAGGGILLEAPTVTLTPTARLLAKGGGGAANTSSAGATPQTEDLTASIGLRCIPQDPQCGNGGNGATVGIAATNGGNTALNSEAFFSGGGGGGGLGRLRINTRDGNYTRNSMTVEAAATTSGQVRTR